MKYIAIDASLNGTGIRDQSEGGYIEPKNLRLSSEIILILEDWLSRYKNEHYNGYEDGKNVNRLDAEGKEIALMIKRNLSEVKVEYFSSARMTKEII